LRALGHLDFNLPIQCWDTELGAEYCIGYFDDFPAPQVCAMAFKAGIALAINDNKQVTRCATGCGTG
jgi:hypothetical protein